MTLALRNAGAHRFPVERPGYIVVTRNYPARALRHGVAQEVAEF